VQEVRRSIEGGEEIISDILPLTSAFVSALSLQPSSAISHLPSDIFFHSSDIREIKPFQLISIQNLNFR
jgi:hypothetical protein